MKELVCCYFVGAVVWALGVQGWKAYQENANPDERSTWTYGRRVRVEILTEVSVVWPLVVAVLLLWVGPSKVVRGLLARLGRRAYRKRLADEDHKRLREMSVEEVVARAEG